MGGFGILAWIAMGSIVGWALSRLMLGSEDDGLRGTAAGMIGAALGGIGIRFLHAAPPPDHQLNGSVAALAGSLWLTWLTCVVTSGRTRGEVGNAPDGAIARMQAALAARLGAR